MLVQTLETYLDLAGDVKATSTRLNLHRSSLYYRLDRITQLLGRDLSGGLVRFELHLALKSRRLHRRILGEIQMLGGRRCHPAGDEPHAPLRHGPTTRLRHAAECYGQVSAKLPVRFHDIVDSLRETAGLHLTEERVNRLVLSLGPATSRTTCGGTPKASYSEIAVCRRSWNRNYFPGLLALMIAECMPSATWWVGVMVMSVNPAATSPSRYSPMESAPAMQAT